MLQGVHVEFGLISHFALGTISLISLTRISHGFTLLITGADIKATPLLCCGSVASSVAFVVV